MRTFIERQTLHPSTHADDQCSCQAAESAATYGSVAAVEHRKSKTLGSWATSWTTNVLHATGEIPAQTDCETADLLSQD